MRVAAKRLKDIVAKKDIIPILTHFIAADGFLYANNGKLSARTPIPTKGDFVVRAAEFYRFMDKVTGDVKISPQENGHVKVSCGRFRATFPGMRPEAAPQVYVEGKGFQITASFIEKLWAVRPFLSDNATQQWATCALVRGDTVYATNNVVVVRANGTGLPSDADFLVSYDAIDFLAARPQGIKSVTWDSHGVLFMWEDGSYLRGPAYSFKFPNLQPIFDSLPDPGWDIPDPWRESYQQLSALGEEDIEFFLSKMVARTATGSVMEAEIDTPIDDSRESMCFKFKFLDPIIKDAKRLWYFVGRGPQIVFQSEYILGTIIGTGK